MVEYVKEALDASIREDSSALSPAASENIGSRVALVDGAKLGSLISKATTKMRIGRLAFVIGVFGAFSTLVIVVSKSH